MKLIKVKGLYSDTGKIELENMKSIYLDAFTDEQHPGIPFGSSVEVSIEFDENDFLAGKDGIVWATYDLRQAEIIQNTLFAQDIYSEIKRIHLGNEKMFLIKIVYESDISDSIGFIWRNNTGLRLKRDWNYSKNKTNESFELWLSGQ